MRVIPRKEPFLAPDGIHQTGLGQTNALLYCLAMKHKVVAAAVLLFALPTMQPSAWAGGNDVENRLKTDYERKVLTLRHFYHGDHLKFHSDGSLAMDATEGPWATDGQISVEEVHLRHGQFEIKGRRIYTIFDSNSKPQDFLTILDRYKGKDREVAEEILRQASVSIEIELPSTTASVDEVAAVMRTVFALPGGSLMEVVPEYWRKYFGELENRPYISSNPAEKLYDLHPGGGVTAPHLTFDPEPEYSDVARKLKYQGTIVLSLVLDPTGTSRNLQITHPLGLGLDERAIDAVKTWKFDPAKKDGVGVPVALSVQVNFRLY